MISNTKKHNKKVRLLKEQNCCCAYCGKKLTLSTATLDHIIPRNMGGTVSDENVVVCCKKCNVMKGCMPLWYCLDIIRTDALVDKFFPIIRRFMRRMIIISFLLTFKRYKLLFRLFLCLLGMHCYRPSPKIFHSKNKKKHDVHCCIFCGKKKVIDI